MLLERLFYQDNYSVRLIEQNLRLPPSNLCLPLAPDEVPTDDSSLLPRFCVHSVSDHYIFALLEIVANPLSAFFSLQPLVLDYCLSATFRNLKVCSCWENEWCYMVHLMQVLQTARKELSRTTMRRRSE